MRRIVYRSMAAALAAAAALLLSVSIGSSAGASELVACPAAQQIVSATAPAFARQDTGIPLALAVADPAAGLQNLARVSGTSVSIFQGASAISTTPVSLTGAITHVTPTAPGTGTTLTLVVTWNQDAGTVAACSGTEAVNLPLIPTAATAGDFTRPRLSGSFAMIVRPYNFHAATTRPKWRFDPSCEYFACGVTLATSLGHVHVLALLKSGLYHGSQDSDAKLTATSCQVLRPHRLTITDAYTSHKDFYVRVKASSVGAVTQITGSIIAMYTPTAAAQRLGCDRTERQIKQLTGQALTRG